MKMKIYFIIIIICLSQSLFSQSIWDAIQNGDIEKVKSFIEKVGVDVNSVKNGSSLLYDSIFYKKLDIVEYLLTSKSFIDDESLKYALDFSKYQVIDLFLKNGLNFYREIVDGEYVRDTFDAQMRRQKKVSDAMELYGLGGLSDDLYKNDPDFELSGKKYNLLDYYVMRQLNKVYAGINIASDRVNTLKLLADYNKTLKSPLSTKVTSTSISCLITLNRLDAVKEYIKSGGTLDDDNFKVLGAADAFDIYLFLKDIDMIPKDKIYIIANGAFENNGYKILNDIYKDSPEDKFFLEALKYIKSNDIENLKNLFQDNPKNTSLLLTQDLPFAKEYNLLYIAGMFGNANILEYFLSFNPVFYEKRASDNEKYEINLSYGGFLPENLLIIGKYIDILHEKRKKEYYVEKFEENYSIFIKQASYPDEYLMGQFITSYDVIDSGSGTNKIYFKCLDKNGNTFISRLIIDDENWLLEDVLDFYNIEYYSAPDSPFSSINNKGFYIQFINQKNNDGKTALDLAKEKGKKFKKIIKILENIGTK